MLTIKGELRALVFVTDASEGEPHGFVLGLSQDLIEGDWQELGVEIQDWPNSGLTKNGLAYCTAFFFNDNSPELCDPKYIWTTDFDIAAPKGDKRAQYAAAEAEMKSIKAMRDVLIAPTNSAWMAAKMVLDHLTEDLGDPVGHCESCDVALFEGDKGHHTSDGCVLCEEHSPTYGDIMRQYTEMIEVGDYPEPFDSLEDFKSVAFELQAHNPAEKALHTL